MTDDKWKDTLDHISSKFSILEEGAEPLLEYPNGKREFVIFESPVGRIRLERITKPRTTGQRALTSRRVGGLTKVEATYDLNDFVHFIEASRWDAASGSWEPFDAGAFA